MNGAGRGSAQYQQCPKEQQHQDNGSQPPFLVVFEKVPELANQANGLLFSLTGKIDLSLGFLSVGHACPFVLKLSEVTLRVTCLEICWNDYDLQRRIILAPTSPDYA